MKYQINSKGYPGFNTIATGLSMPVVSASVCFRGVDPVWLLECCALHKSAAMAGALIQSPFSRAKQKHDNS